MFEIAPKNKSIPNQPLLSRRAVWLLKIKSKVMNELVTPGLHLRVYMSSHERRARKFSKGDPSDVVGAIIDNTIRRIIHREILPRAMSAIVTGLVISLFGMILAVYWCSQHGEELGRIYVSARGLPVMSPIEQRAGVAGQILSKAGVAAKDSAKGKLLNWFQKKQADSNAEDTVKR